ncbi:cob(I)yrinic acid a,c-diamide adenosyltransferase [bacterium]|nr:cob(I)yrinic acid a,c-diamide adenosyltransferase [bacterium]
MRITRVYTRTGDGGDTRLGGGQKVRKESLRIEAYGTVDELSSYLGVAVAACEDAEIRSILEETQHRLFDVGGDLCVLDRDKKKFGMPTFPKDEVDLLERVIDRATDELGPLEEFIIPGGSAASAHLHVARCICRRAERIVVALSRKEDVSDQVVPYLNRLSDALFVLARLANKRAGRRDVFWKRKHGLKKKKKKKT